MAGMDMVKLIDRQCCTLPLQSCDRFDASQSPPTIRSATQEADRDRAKRYLCRFYRRAVLRDSFDVAVIGAAATAEHGEMREVAAEAGVLPTEFCRIAGIEIGCRVEFGMAAPGSIGANAA